MIHGLHMTFGKKGWSGRYRHL